MKNNLPLFWYSLYKFNPPPPIFSRHWARSIINREKENFGDLLSKYIYHKMTGAQPKWYNPIDNKPEPHYLSVGSILNFADSTSIVWGSGIIDLQHDVKNCDFRAVRGPATRQRLLELGYACPNVYGDPCLLLPEFYQPKIKKQWEVGIVPHFYDFSIVKGAIKDPAIKIIEILTNDVEKTTREILSCKKIISSSLHGIITAHAYGIPAIWVQFSNKISGDGVKFKDYFTSVEMVPYTGEFWKGADEIVRFAELFEEYPTRPKEEVVSALRKGLLSSCPF